MNELPIEINVQEVKALMDQGEEQFLLLDCRNPDEYELVNLESAKLIPMGEIQQRVGEIEPFKDSRIVVHCHLGSRSRMVTEWLRSEGFGRTQNMAGGIDAWSQVIDPAKPRY